MKAIAHPLTPLFVLAVATTIMLCVFASAGRAPSLAAETVLRYSWALMLLLWMDADARQLRRRPCYDFGFLAAIFFPVSFLWYCLWSRGWRGLLTLLILLALLLGPYVITVIFWVAWSVAV